MDLTEKILTAGDLCELTGISTNTFRSMTNNGALTPVANGEGPGNHKLYSVLDAVAAAYGKSWLDAGVNYSFAADVTRFIASQKPARLEQAFAEGRTLAIFGSLIKPPSTLGESLNLELMYLDATARVSSFQQFVRNGRGRTTGLASRY